MTVVPSWSSFRGAALALVAVTAFAAPSVRAAAPAQAMLVLDGPRTAYTDVTLRAPFSVNYERSSFDGAGQYAGFYAESLDVPTSQRTKDGYRIGAVSLRDFHGPNENGYTLDLGFTSKSLKAGRYRFYLAADAPATVRIAISGATSYRLSPRRPATAAAAVHTDILVNQFQAANRQVIQLPAVRTLAISSLVFGRFRAYAGQLEACLTHLEGQCGTYGVDGEWSGAIISPLGETTMQWSVQYEPGLLHPGRYDAVQDVLNAGTLQFASAAAFALGLT